MFIDLEKEVKSSGYPIYYSLHHTEKIEDIKKIRGYQACQTFLNNNNIKHFCKSLKGLQCSATVIFIYYNVLYIYTNCMQT